MAKSWLPHNFGRDSQLRKSGSVPTRENSALRLKLARIREVLPEGTTNVTGVVLEDTSGLTIGTADWPYPGTVTNQGGLPGGPITGIHGLWSSPQEGMTVLVGFRDGSESLPIVLGVYPIPAYANPASIALHNLPVTSRTHSQDDVVIGHYAGCYLGFRAEIPYAGAIEAHSPSTFSVTTDVSVEMDTPQYTLTTPTCTFSMGADSIEVSNSTCSIVMNSTIEVSNATCSIVMDSEVTLSNPTSSFALKTAGIVGDAPTYELTADSITLQDNSGNKIEFVGGVLTITSSGQTVTISAGAITASGAVSATGAISSGADVTAGSTSLKTHVHSGVTPGIGNSGPPV